MTSVSAEVQSSRRSVLGAVLRSAVLPILTILTALLVASLAMLASNTNPIRAYVALAEGAFGTQKALIQTAIKTTPFILAGLAIALAFRGGLFNIGVEGQLAIGSVAAAYIGYSFELPGIIHLPLMLLGGALAGALWAAIPGLLKARTGAHEVITTIMANFIALRIISWLVSSDGPMKGPNTTVPETPAVFPGARLPLLIPDTRLHAGILLALVTAGIIYWLLWRTVIGFEIRTVGANPSAAHYAGMSVGRTIVLTMTLSGLLAGFGGAIQVAGLPPYNYALGFNTGYGFDSIAVAVLGGIHPAGVVLSSFMFGAMDAGAQLMQLRTKVPIDIVTIVQGLVLMFVAADQIIRAIYRIRVQREEDRVNLGRLWGGGPS